VEQYLACHLQWMRLVISSSPSTSNHPYPCTLAQWLSMLTPETCPVECNRAQHCQTSSSVQ
jgi:hypothetical protein